MDELSDRQIAPLLELDPDLGQLLDGERLGLARRALRVSIRTLHAGEWDADKMGHASPEHIGLLLLDGVISREVLVSDIVSTELLGRGDVVRPWRIENDDTLLDHTVRWTVLSRTTAALLDRRFAAESGRYPEIGAAIVDRVNERAQRLAVTQAISQLNRVDRRLLAFFWHLADRWGRMTPEGVAVPLTLSHRMLGQLVGARRPTVSTALAELAKQELVHRRSDGTWILTGEPVGLPRPQSDRVIPIRRRLLPPASSGVAEAVQPAALLEFPAGRGDELRRALRRVREQSAANTGVTQELMVLTTQLTAHNAELRDRCQMTRRRRNGGAAVRAAER